MTRLLKRHPPNLTSNPLKYRTDGEILHLVVSAVEEERGCGDEREVGDDGPGFERAGDEELGGAVPMT